MADTTFTPNDDLTPDPTAKTAAKSHFAKAVEEAKAGAQALGKEAQERAGVGVQPLEGQPGQPVTAK